MSTKELDTLVEQEALLERAEGLLGKIGATEGKPLGWWLSELDFRLRQMEKGGYFSNVVFDAWMCLRIAHLKMGCNPEILIHPKYA